MDFQQILKYRIIEPAQRVAQFFTGLKDKKPLNHHLNCLVNLHETINADVYQLTSVYNEYIANISTEEMAVSLETAFLLYSIAEEKGYTRILDLGSGYSSYVMRTYAAKSSENVTVYSIDDNEFWLDKTGSFLKGYNLSSDNLMTWEKFIKHNTMKFDLIFHDLGSMETRAEILPLVLGLLDKNGVVVLDDMHKPDYRKIAKREVEKTGYALYSARTSTLDNYKRYSEIVLGGE